MSAGWLFRSFRILVPTLLLSVWLTACGGGGGSSTPTPPTPPAPSTKDITAVNHVIIMLQQNHSFDHYFGQMTAYRQRNGIPIVSSDGKIDDLSTGNYANTVKLVDGSSIQIPVAPTGSVCTEDVASDWNEAHKEMDLRNPSAAGPGSPMDGFAQTGYDIGQWLYNTYAYSLVDQTGRRAMHYYDDTDLNYYYFMASNFAMSDALFTPIPSRFLSRLYLYAGTSQGLAHEPKQIQISAKTIFELLDAAGVSWKIYIANYTYLQYFTYYNLASTKTHVVPVSEYFTDLQNGTLPSVAIIEPDVTADEHPSNYNPSTNTLYPSNIQYGAKRVSTLINALMASSSWKDSVFFFGYDEGGGFYDHVPPISVPSPDGIPPQDLAPGDPSGDFTISGFRVANFIVSPFARKNYVSHTPMDFTAYLKFIQTRWKLPHLTNRDAAMPDMTEFFDFNAAPWATPPTPPTQVINDSKCNFALQ